MYIQTTTSTSSGLIVNSVLEAMATTLTKLKVIGVKLQVIEVKNLEFYIDFKKYSIKQSKQFQKFKYSTRYVFGKKNK